jgi:hypothetical protein
LGFSCPGQNKKQRDQQCRSDEILHAARLPFDMLRGKEEPIDG